MYLGLFLFGARGFATGVFQAVFVYTPEVYPTKYRGSAMGLMTSFARIGALITPFIAQVCVCGCVCVGGRVCVWVGVCGWMCGCVCGCDDVIDVHVLNTIS